MLHNFYAGKSVFVTGHTGFKGSWLCLWLTMLGAKVTALSLPPNTDPNHFVLLKPDYQSVVGDIRDADLVKRTVQSCQPEVVFHLAAQASVLYSYQHPLETIASNVSGTANVLNACRDVDSVRSIVIITTDKCYRNREWLWGYREQDELGGHDPYSASKACSELVTASFRDSFFPVAEHGRSHSKLVASVRAGNVIGGGDWVADRLVTDIMKFANEKKPTLLRNPHSVRPWQHVLEPLNGYLLLGSKLHQGDTSLAGPFNFGPDNADQLDVLTVTRKLKGYWDDIEYTLAETEQKAHEAKLLRLDCTKSREVLGWRPVWTGDVMFEKTAEWYRSFYREGRILSEEQLKEYCAQAEQESGE